MDCPTPGPACPSQVTPPVPGRKRELFAKLLQVRHWVQLAFTGLWLAPLGEWMQRVPGCVFHCYSCPWSSVSCPVGIAAQYAALFPVALEIPYLLLGVLLVVAAVSGSLVCGWACPFGFLQDLLGKLVPRKLPMPGWLGYFRYVVLVGLVLLWPAILGYQGIPFEHQVVSICRWCPAGALEAGVPYSISSVLDGHGWLMSGLKTGILVVFLLLSVVFLRPWCRIFCPLGGFLALFNRFSLFHLQFKGSECKECNLCRSHCAVGVKVDEKINVTGCIRCLECTRCGAVDPAFALPEKAAEQAHAAPK